MCISVLVGENMWMQQGQSTAVNASVSSAPAGLPKVGEWLARRRAALGPSATIGHTVTYLSPSRLLLFGGEHPLPGAFTRNSRSSRLYLLDGVGRGDEPVDISAIESLAVPPPRRQHAAAAVSPDELLVVGGLGANGFPVGDAMVASLDASSRAAKWMPSGAEDHFAPMLARAGHSLTALPPLSGPLLLRSPSDAAFLVFGGLQSNRVATLARTSALGNASHAEYVAAAAADAHEPEASLIALDDLILFSRGANGRWRLTRLSFPTDAPCAAAELPLGVPPLSASARAVPGAALASSERRSERRLTSSARAVGNESPMHAEQPFGNESPMHAEQPFEQPFEQPARSARVVRTQQQRQQRPGPLLPTTALPLLPVDETADEIAAADWAAAVRRETAPSSEPLDRAAETAAAETATEAAEAAIETAASIARGKTQRGARYGGAHYGASMRPCARSSHSAHLYSGPVYGRSAHLCAADGGAGRCLLLYAGSSYSGQRLDDLWLLSLDPSTLMTLDYDPSTLMTLDYDPSTLMALDCDPSTLMTLDYNPSTLMTLDYDPSTLMTLDCDGLRWRAPLRINLRDCTPHQAGVVRAMCHTEVQAIPAGSLGND